MTNDWNDRERYGRNDYGNDRGRAYRSGSRDRDWTDRVSDEARSWFGDDDGDRGRHMDDIRRDGMRANHRGYRGGGGGDYRDYRGGGDDFSGYGGRDHRGSSRDDYGGYGDRAQGGGPYGGNREQSGGGYRESSLPGRGGYDRDPNHGGPYSDYGGRSGRGSGGHDGDRGFLERAGDEVASWFGDEDAERRRRMDDRNRGRGPKNYSRSDDRIREDVSDRLSDDPHIDASDIEVSVKDGEVTLSGTVEERFAKRHAEDIAERVSGIKHVQNNLRVSDKGNSQASGGAGSVAGRSGTTGGAGGAVTPVTSGNR